MSIDKNEIIEDFLEELILKQVFAISKYVESTYNVGDDIDKNHLSLLIDIKHYLEDLRRKDSNWDYVTEEYESEDTECIVSSYNGHGGYPKFLAHGNKKHAK